MEEREREGGGRGREGVGWGRGGGSEEGGRWRKGEEGKGGEKGRMTHREKRESFIFPSNFISKSELSKSNFTT